MYLLDTNACIRVLNNSSSTLTERLARQSPSELRLCSVVKAELLYGARLSSRQPANMRLLRTFFAPFVSLPFDDASAERYGVIRGDLHRAGRPIGPNDLMIAAIALTHDLVLVTHNADEFGRVVDLRIEDWENPSYTR